MQTIMSSSSRVGNLKSTLTPFPVRQGLSIQRGLYLPPPALDPEEREWWRGILPWNWGADVQGNDGNPSNLPIGTGNTSPSVDPLGRNFDWIPQRYRTPNNDR
jgi:hypothetical protein